MALNEDGALPSVMEFDQDISTAEAPPPLPTGKYRAEIRKAEPTLNKEQTSSYVATAFYISPDQYPADYTEGSPDGITVIYRRCPWSNTPKGRFGLRRFLESLGLKGGKSVDLNELIGVEAIVTIAHDTRPDGTKAENITKVEPANN
jgi:hypothetical protein